jgi:hypothetical protein
VEGGNGSDVTVGVNAVFYWLSTALAETRAIDLEVVFTRTFRVEFFGKSIL